MAGRAASRQKLVVLDTNVLLHLAEQYAPAHNLVIRLRGAGFTPVVTQTVVQELAHATEYGDSPRKQASAARALASMLSWGIQPTSLKPVGNAICDVVANMFSTKKLLPEAERNDAYVLIEASFWNASMLITWDSHLLDASQSGLNEVLISFDLHPVQIVHPKTLLGYEAPG